MDSSTTQAYVVNPTIGDRGTLFVSTPESPAKGPWPFVFAIHGGGWGGGDQHGYDWILPLFHSLGVAVALPGYRLSAQAPFPAAFDDLVVVLRWIRDNAADCNLDPARCLLFGGSAGGHLAMLLATRSSEFCDTIPGIRGVAQYCGIMDPIDQFDFDCERSAAMTRNFLGGTPADLPDLYRQASPIHNIPHSLPPIWMAHGSSDTCVPFRQSTQFVAALRSCGHNPIFHEARELGHTMIEIKPGGDAVSPYRALFQSDLCRFVQRCLEG